MTHHYVAVGIFDDRDSAGRAIHDLRRAGFIDGRIGFAVLGSQNAPDGASDQAAQPGADTGTLVRVAGSNVLGALPDTHRELLVSESGMAVAGGMLTSALKGMSGEVAPGGLLRALTDLGVPQEEAVRYQRAFEAGCAIVAVQPEGRDHEALNILHRHHAYNATTLPPHHHSPQDAHASDDAAPSSEQPTVYRFG